MAHPNELIQRAYDRELEPADKARLDAHLASCSRCRSVLKAQQQIDSYFQRSEPLEPSADFTQRIKRQMATVRPPRRLTPWRIPVALFLSALGLLAIMFVSEDFLALTATVTTAAEALTVWMMAAAGGSGTNDTAVLTALDAQTNLALVFGLCLLGGASVLILRQHTELP